MACACKGNKRESGEKEVKRGLFITLEGTDGSGKSTQIDNIRDYFDVHGIAAVFTREPGGTEIGEKIRSIILDKENNAMTGLTEMYLYAAARAQHSEEFIRPALEDGLVVVCDRYIDSSIAYQGSGRGLGDKVKKVNSFAIEGAIPDITLFFDLDPDTGKQRICKGRSCRDRMELAGDEFHRAVYEGYKTIAKEEERVVTIDASKTEEEVKVQVFAVLDRIFRRM